MLHKQSKKSAAMRIVAFIPLIAIAIILLSFTSIDKMPNQSISDIQLLEKDGIIKPTLLMPSKLNTSFQNTPDTGKVVKSESAKKPTKQTEPILYKNQDGTLSDVYTVVTNMPTFTGGEKARIKFLSENLKYPEDARKNKIQGTSYIRFIIEKDGSISNINLLRGFDSSVITKQYG